MIAIDWGSSSLRAYRLDAAGGILEQRRSDQGVLLCNGEFTAVLLKLIEGWEDPVILLAGMIGSRSGWREMPYLDCPVGVQELATALEPMQISELQGRTVLPTSLLPACRMWCAAKKPRSVVCWMPCNKARMWFACPARTANGSSCAMVACSPSIPP